MDADPCKPGNIRGEFGANPTNMPFDKVGRLEHEEWIDAKQRHAIASYEFLERQRLQPRWVLGLGRRVALNGSMGDQIRRQHTEAERKPTTRAGSPQR